MQELDKNDILKDTSSIKVGGEMLQTVEIVGLPLKDESEPHIGDAVQGIDSKDRMANITVSGLSGMQELDKNDILKDTSSIKVGGEMLQTVEIVGLPLKDDSEPHIGDAVQGIDSKERMANVAVSGLSGMHELSKNDILKDTSSIKVGEMLQTVEDVGLPLKDDSEPHIGDAVQGIDSKDRMTNITVSGLSGMQELSKSDILKDTSSIKVGEMLQTVEVVGLPLKDNSKPHIGDAVRGIDSKDRMANITVSGLSGMQELSKNNILKDTSSIKVGEMLQTVEVVGLPLKDNSKPHIGDAVQGIDSKDRMANITVSGLSGIQELSKSDILKDTSSIKVGEMLQTMEVVGLPLKDDSEPHIGDAMQGIDIKDRMTNITVSGLSGMQELHKNDVLKDTNSIKVLEAGDFQTSSASSSSATARKNSECTYPSELNPFGNDDGDTEQTNKDSVVYKPSERKVAKEINPFGSTDDEAEMQIMVESPTPLVPVTRGRMKKVLEAPKVNLNPFWSDGEEPSSGDENADSSCSKSEKLPVPRPRTLM